MSEIVGVQLVADQANAYLAALQAIDAASQTLVSGVRATASALTAFEAGLATAARGATQLDSAATPASSAVDALGDDATASARDAAALGAAADAAGSGVKGLGDTAGKAGDEAGGLGEKAKPAASGIDAIKEAAIGAARRLGELAVDGLRAAAAAFGQWVTDGIGAAGDFEAKMNEFAAVTGDALDDSGQSLGEFKQLFIDLGRELPVSTADVQQAAIEMAKGGIEPATIAAVGLRTALNLAAAGGVEIADSAEIMAKQLGVWSDKADDAATRSAFLSQAADLISQAALASVVNVDDLALGLANAGGVAKIAGLSFRETVTTMALLAPGFSSAADAGTSFKTFLARLQPTTNAAADAMASLNLLTADGKSKFYDATGSFIGMEQAAELLHGALDGMSEAQKESTLQAIFGQDAIRAAAMIAEQGADGYRTMAGEMAGLGSVAEQAAQRQQGFNVAVNNIQGSLEALQITVGGAILPALTGLINVVAGGINVVTEYAAATIEGKTALSAFGQAISDYGTPAVVGLTGAVIAWALAQSGAALPAILQMIPAIVAQTSAFVANAAAVAAALAPYALIALAIGGVAKAWSDFNDKIADATRQLLESRSWWNDSTAAINDYSNATGAAKTKLEPYIQTMNGLRDAIRGQIEDLGRRQTAGLVSQAQADKELAQINAMSNQLAITTEEYHKQEQALIAQAAAGATATNALASLSSGTDLLGDAASLTAQDIESLTKQIQSTYEKGQSALDAYAQSSADYLRGLEDRQTAHAATIAALEKQKQDATSAAQKAGIDTQIQQANDAYAQQEQAQAASYATQQAAQQQHLGQMLIDYTVAQAELGNITKEKAAEITAALEHEYGLQESSTATTFLTMAGSIDRYAQDSGGSINDLIGNLRDNQQAAADTKKAMDDYAGEYVATQVNNFLDGEQDADALLGKLNALPRQIEISVVTTYTERGRQRQGGQIDGDDGPEARASGGPVAAGTTYLVGEAGRELFVPDRDGYVLSHPQTRRAEASAQQLQRMATVQPRAAGPSITYQMPIYTNQTPAVLQQSLALIEAMV